MPAIELTPAFRRRLRKKTEEQVAAILHCIERLESNPRHPGLNTHKMVGIEGVWEAYVDAGNRVTFHYDRDTIVMRNHCNHDMLYRNP